MLRVSVEASCLPPSSLCSICGRKSSVRCKDCGPSTFYCVPCTEVTHSLRHPLHTPEIWKDNMFVPYTLENDRILRRIDHVHCETSALKEIVCVDKSGNQHRLKVEACLCEPEAVTLLRFNLWPATPTRPTLAFEIDLLEWLEALFLECCIGVQGFCRSVEVRLGCKISRKFREMYPVLIDAFEEYRFLKYQHRSLDFVSPALNTTATCPACPEKEGVRFESLDAVFGLCRKKAAGVSVRPPLFGSLFFESQEDVDSFVSSYGQQKVVPPQGCHDFLAGDALRSQSRFKALDETALFGWACRHEFPKHFLNLKHGERLSYAVYCLEKLHSTDSGSNMVLLYDIACMLDKHIHARGLQHLLEGVTLATPTFHSYGHSAECQAKYNPRRISGCGLTDGEVMERLWSYLRRMARTTKEMRPSHRIDILTSALIHYATKSARKLVNLLPKRLKHATDVLEKASADIDGILSTAQVPITEETIMAWSEMEKTVLSRKEAETSYGQRHKVFQRIFKLVHERKFLLLQKAKYADGQAIAKRLSKKITATTSSLKQAVNRFNNLEPDPLEGSSYILPGSLTWSTVSNTEEIRKLELEEVHSGIELPEQAIRKAIDAVNLKARAREEIPLLIGEMECMLKFYKKEHFTILEHMETFAIQAAMQETLYTNGCLNLLNRRLLQCELMLEAACVKFSPHLPHPTELPQFRIISASQNLSDLSSTVSDPFLDSNSDFLASSEERSDEEDSDSDIQSDDDDGEGTVYSSTAIPAVVTYETAQETNDEQADSDECGGFDIHQKFELYRSERFHREEFMQAQNSALCNEPDISESLPFRINDTTGWTPQHNTQQKAQTSVFYKNPGIAKKLLEASSTPSRHKTPYVFSLQTKNRDTEQ